MPEERKPDTARALSVLKDFQRQTVDYVYRRLYEEGAKRFLIADEVGLGKTLVARGLIARAIDRLWEGEHRIERIDVIYVCSNADIARQNINRLNVEPWGGADVSRKAHATRLTLLPLHLGDLNASRVNFISFTPGTSFNLRSSGGIARERALIYWLLREGWGFGDRAGPKNLLQYYVTKKETWRDYYLKNVNMEDVNPGLTQGFLAALAKRPRLRRAFDELADRFGYYRKHVPDKDRETQGRFIGEVRQLLAETCCHALEPDIIILDEFQRFRDLLDGEDEAAELARTLFEYKDAKVLLLSATPYKAYTLYQEGNVDDHYTDFLRTMEFLFDSKAETERLSRDLREYREALLDAGPERTGRLAAARERIEAVLRRVMVRTERLSSSQDRSGMLRETGGLRVRPGADDLREFALVDAVARAIDVGEPLEYWKSAPYVLNTMDRTGYKIKKRFVETVEEPAPDVAGTLAGKGRHLLRWSDIQTYQELVPPNARLRRLMADTVGRGAWKLLWIPPCIPYYRPDRGPYAEATGAPQSKHLVFSSWRIVPKVIAMLCSYDAERRMVGEDGERLGYARHAQARARLLEFPVTEGNPDRMANLVPFYPCWTLASRIDPLALAVAGAGDGKAPAYESVAERVRGEIERLVAPLLRGRRASGRGDQAWYWAALALLDMRYHQSAVEPWLASDDADIRWADMQEAQGEEGQFAAHVEQFRSCARGAIGLGDPPDDLVDVLVQVALGSPAVTALRSLFRLYGNSERRRHAPLFLASAARVALGFRTLFNLSAVTDLLQELHSREDLHYWEAVLEYCEQGNLQAVLDEYVHVLRDSLGLTDKGAEKSLPQLAEEIETAVSIRTVNLDFDDVLVSEDRTEVDLETHSIRCRFALRFGDLRAEEERGYGGYRTRKEQVRQAFNSPFWPFIVATTSVGQEGLDFHQYCMNVCHWNLPNNPVDLEQREGRVHRYKGHAIRHSIAARYGLKSPANGTVALSDLWAALFARARAEFAGEHSELVPYWVVPGAEHKITRHVPTYPLSRDGERYERLKRAVAMYRLVFGQPRQEDLLAYIHSHWGELSDEDALTPRPIDLSPRAST